LTVTSLTVRFIRLTWPLVQGMRRICQPMIDVVLRTGEYSKACSFSDIEGSLGVGRGRACIAWRGEVGSVVGEDRVDLGGDGGD
jgi:hypothetical protein